MLWLYLIFMNAAAFAAFGIDKLAAVRHWRRIRESSLLELAFFGGSAGALTAMYLFRHKIRKSRFRIGIPLMLILQIAVWIFVLKK